MDQLGTNVILRGQFEPTLFQPEWLFLHEIESRTHMNKTKIWNLDSNLVDIVIENTRYFIEKNQIIVLNNKISMEKIINDKLFKLFNLFPHIGSHTIALIKFKHIELEDVSQWNKICNQFSPMEPWSDLGLDVSKAVNDSQFGLRSLNVVFPESHDRCKLTKFVKIEPSAIFNPGVFVQIDFAFEYGQYLRAIDMIEIAQKEVGKRTQEAEKIFEFIREKR